MKNLVQSVKKERKGEFDEGCEQSIYEIDRMTKESISSEEWATIAKSRSRVYGFLGALYCRRPDEQFASSLLGQELTDFLSCLSETEELSEDMRTGVSLIDQFIQASEGKSIDELKTEVGVERTRLLRGVKPGYGPPPPYESVYSSQKRELDAYRVAAVLKVYAEAEVILPEDNRDQPDYIGIELDFMRHLCAKESEAWSSNNRGQALNYIGKERCFLEEHINQWIPQFCEVMTKDARLDLYRGIARITRGFVLDESQRSSEYLELTSTA